MQLTKVYSNKPSFKTVEFKQNSLNIIFGGKSDPDNKSTDRTFNGVGKSLLLSIIDYCLGSDNNAFKSSLSDWIFFLDFEHDGKNYTVRRAATDTNKVYLNEEEFTLDGFNKFMEEMLFEPSISKYPDISYRTIMNRFLRAKKQSYVNWDTVFFRETPFRKLVNNFYLLGFDVNYVIKKKLLKIESDKVKVILDTLDKDDEIKIILTKYSNIDIAISEIKSKLKDVNAASEQYEVAETSKQIKEEADTVAYEHRQLLNELYILERRLENIAKSISSTTIFDIDKNFILDAYKKISVELPELLKKSVEETMVFHNAITQKRVAQLKKQKKEIEITLIGVRKELSIKASKLNSLIRVLGKGGALEEYSTLAQQKAQYVEELKSLERYKDLIEHAKIRNTEIKIERAEAEKEALDYKLTLDSLNERNNQLFKELSETFYPNKYAGITIQENTKKNQTQFDIDVHIKYDGSDGIAGVKMLCFDLTILSVGKHHGIRFLAHDSRILSDTDARQVAVFLKLVSRICRESNLQYILTLNQDFLDQIKNQEYLSPDEIEDIQSKEVLLLKDGSPEGKLLGEDIEVLYDK